MDRGRAESGARLKMVSYAERHCLSHKLESNVRKLPSPTCGRGVRGEGAVCQRVRNTEFRKPLSLTLSPEGRGDGSRPG
jgi:hypothetical protein